MPPKQKTPEGELTVAEIRKLIRAHNILTKIKLPTKLDRDGVIAFLKKNKFEVDHKNERLIDKSPNRGKSISLGTAKVITKPKPKTEAQVKATAEKKVKKELKEKLKSEKPTPTFNPKDVKVVGVKGEKKPKPAPKKPKPAPKKLGKSIQEDIQGGVELNEDFKPMGKDRCKLFIYVSKQIIKADKDNFKKVRIYTNAEEPNDLSNFGSSLAMGEKARPTPLLKLFDFMTQINRWEDTMREIRKDCGVQEAIFVETAYDILYRRFDLIKERIMKQNPKLKGLDKFVKKPKKIDYLYYSGKD